MDRSARRVLMVAFQFPPYDVSTGTQRILGFVRHLPAQGWSPIVVTARASTYSHTDPATLQLIPAGTPVLRAFGFDVARKLSVRGIYPRPLGTPDRWNSWILGAVATGLKAVRNHKPAALWATFPIPSAIAAALLLKRFTGLPLIGDLRDPMVYETWPENSWDRRTYGVLERALVRHASAVVLTTQGAGRLYRERYPQHAHKFAVIPNGMEPLIDPPLSSTPRQPVSVPADPRSGLTLVHSGLMEIPDRDPTAFFSALRLLSDQGQLPEGRFRVVLRASGLESQFVESARAHGVSRFVSILPRVSRDEALQEMREASGLLLFQGKACNRQIPAKAYEYLFLDKPIVCLADSAGDTRGLVHDEWGVPYCADMESPPEIAEVLSLFLADHANGTVFVPPAALRERHTRRAASVMMAQLLDKIAPVHDEDVRT